MIEIFIITNLFFICYFLFANRYFDLFSLAYFSSVIYFLPAFFGVDIQGNSIHKDTYLVYNLVQFYIFLATLYNDYIFIKLKPVVFFKVNKSVYFVMLIFMCSILFIMLISYGPFIFFMPKTEMGMNSYIIIFWRVTSTLVFIYGYLLKNRLMLILSGIVLTLTFISSDRTAVALTILAIILLYFSQRKERFLIKYWKFIPLFLIFLILILFGKSIHVIIHLVNSGMSFSMALNSVSPENLKTFIITTEPFIIQLILNKIIILDYQIQEFYLKNFFLYLLPTTGPFDIDSAVFNDYIQKDIFTEFKSRSIAYNFWAEGYAIGKWWMLNLFIIIWILLISILNYLLRTPNLFFKGLFSIMGVYLVFYIHRNSVFSIMSYEKHFFYFAFISLIISFLIKDILEFYYKKKL